MKHLLFIQILALLIGLTSCGPKITTLPYDGWFFQVNGSTTDLVCLQGWGLAKNQDQVLSKGTKAALEALVLRGIPDSPYRSPMITKNESNSMEIRQLLEREHLSYIADALLISPPSRANRNSVYTAPVQVTIDLNSLRRDLQRKGFVPKFGL